MVDDLLDAESARRGELPLEKREVDLRSIVADAANTFRPRAQQGGVELGHTMPATPTIVMGDVVGLQQIANVLDNAVKHTPVGGRIRLPTVRRDGHAVMGVRDGQAHAPTRSAEERARRSE